MLAIGVSICALLSLPLAGAQVFQAVAASGPLKERAPEAAVALRNIGGLLGCCAFVYSIFVFTPMTFGLLAFAIGATREGSVRFALLLEGYRRFPRVLGTTLLLAVVAWVPLLLGLAVAGAITAFGVGFERFQDGIQRTDFDDYSRVAIALGAAWMFACVMVSWWIYVRTSFAYLRIVDPAFPTQRVVDAVESSWRMTRGSAFSLIGLFVTLAVMTTATLLACVVPYLLVGVPFMLTIIASAYLQFLGTDAGTDDLTATGY